MIALNLTLVVELALFLMFLWGLNVLVLRPMLGLLDEREEKLSRDEEAAEMALREAEEAEQRYASELSAARREASLEAERARRQAASQRAQRIEEARRQSESEVSEARAEARRQLRSERDQFPRLSGELAEAIEPHVYVKERTA